MVYKLNPELVIARSGLKSTGGYGMKSMVIFLAVSIGLTGMAAAQSAAPVNDGLYRAYYESGAIEKEENYKFRLRDGVSTEYYENGARKSEDHYVAGVREGAVKTYYDSGVVKTDGIYHMNNLEGVLKSYDRSGLIQKEENYKNGILDGETRLYFPTGIVRRQMYYVNGVLNGTAIENFEDGKMKTQETYKDGERVSSTTFESASDLMTKKAVSPKKDKAQVLKPGVKTEEKVTAKVEKPVEEKK
jgi:antitoxin component YwqK of YwqJK toxin-antitoxin module